MKYSEVAHNGNTFRHKSWHVHDTVNMKYGRIFKPLGEALDVVPVHWLGLDPDGWVLVQGVTKAKLSKADIHKILNNSEPIPDIEVRDADGLNGIVYHEGGMMKGCDKEKASPEKVSKIYDYIKGIQSRDADRLRERAATLMASGMSKRFIARISRLPNPDGTFSFVDEADDLDLGAYDSLAEKFKSIKFMPRQNRRPQKMTSFIVWEKISKTGSKIAWTSLNIQDSQIEDMATYARDMAHELARDNPGKEYFVTCGMNIVTVKADIEQGDTVRWVNPEKAGTERTVTWRRGTSSEAMVQFMGDMPDKVLVSELELIRKGPDVHTFGDVQLKKITTEYEAGVAGSKIQYVIPVNGNPIGQAGDGFIPFSMAGDDDHYKMTLTRLPS